MIYVVIYLLVAMLIPLWDSYIGFGFEFPRIEDGPNAVLAGLLWPIGLPIILMICFSNLLDSAKQRRKERTRKKEKIRVAQEEVRLKQEREVELALRQVEEELNHVKAKG